MPLRCSDPHCNARCHGQMQTCTVLMPRFLKHCGALRKASNGASQQEERSSGSEVGQHVSAWVKEHLVSCVSLKSTYQNFFSSFILSFILSGLKSCTVAQRVQLKSCCSWVQVPSMPAQVLDLDEILHEQGEESDWQEPCTVCGRRYYHEHVRSMSKGNAHGEDADTDDM